MDPSDALDGAQAVDAQVVVSDCTHCKALPERVAHVDAFGNRRLVLALPDGARATFPFFQPTSERLTVLHAPDSPIAIALGQQPMIGFTTRAELPRAFASGHSAASSSSSRSSR